MNNKPSAALKLALEEVIDQFKKDGYTEKCILETFKMVFENMRDPQPELKGEMDT